ncbi:MAG: SAM-dependent methyltransferase [Frankiales bacterium]|nr:SAM-dependent methyltransferase [Frankiales bacterium]
MSRTYDVVVVGGGAAGLSGALALGRARRSVLVIEHGAPRNAQADQVHNYLGREGTPPAELLAIARSEVAQYGVELLNADALAATKLGDGTFVVTLADRQVGARRLLVASGLVDELPDISGVAEGWGQTVLHCPYCHGWEVQDQPLGVLGQSPLSIHQAQLFRQWSDDIVLFQHTSPAPTEEQAEQLSARGIRVVVGEVVGWEPGGVRLASGELVARQALVVGADVRARAEVLLSLGLETAAFEVDGHVYGTYVPADRTGLTAMPGVWVAGNITDPRAQVISSAAAGLQAGAAINADLISEETHLAVERLRFFGAQAWEARYSAKPDGIWSGDPNAVLVAETADLTPGTALDVGCGEGADALWLAARGWRVTGADISTVALGRAAAQGESQGLEVDWRHVDLLAEPPRAGEFDLVTAHFMQLPAADRAVLYEHLAAAVSPGGTLLLVGHHPSDMHTTMGRPHLHDMFFTPEQLVADLDPKAWEVLVAEARPRQANDPDGKQVTIRDTLVRARRR